MPSPKEIEPLLAPIKPNDSLINNSTDSIFLPNSTILFTITQEETYSIFEESEEQICFMVKEFYGKGKEKIIGIIFKKK